MIDVITNTATLNNRALSNVWFYVSLFCVIFLLTRLSNILNQFLGDIQTQKLTDYISNLLHKKSVELDLAFYDNPQYHDTFHRAQQEANYRPILILNNITELLILSFEF